MPTTGFFGFLWRFNAVVIAVAGIGTLALGAVLFNGFFGYTRSYYVPDTNLVGTTPGAAKPPTLVLGGPRSIKGTAFLAFSLIERNEEGRGSFGSGSFGSAEGGTVRNVLLVDGASAQGHWLFDGTNKVIASYDPETQWFPQLSANGTIASQPADQRGLWFGVREDSKPETTTLLVYAVGEGKFHTIASGIDVIRAVQQVDQAKALVVYEAGEKTIATTVSLTDFSTMASNELPRLAAGGAH